MESHPFRLLRNLGRSREIATVLLRNGFSDLVEQLRLRRYVRWGKRVLFRQELEPEHRFSRAERIRMTLESLGATFIKFGQVISTRPDLVPRDVIEELSHLQERCPPFPSHQARAILEEQFGKPVHELFAEFEPEPIAAGSLAQVHRARHRSGTLVAVKIRRPGVVRVVERDLALMQEMALLVERHIPEADIFDPVGLVNQFARVIRREMNFAREGRTMQEFARLFRHDATLVVPKIFAELTNETVLTMEYIEGHRVDDHAGLRAEGISIAGVAANGARIYMKQAFELGIFHGDPHPGNIRILADGSICLLDYGMVGVLEDQKREQLVDLFLAINRREVAQAVEVIRVLGQPSRELDAALLRVDLREFIENYYVVPLEQLNVGNMLTDFVTILANHRIRCPSDLMLLIRALVTLEGVGRGLDPSFNMAEHLAPFIERVVSERYNPGRIVRQIISESSRLLKTAHDVPLHLARSLDKLSRDDMRVQIDHHGIDHLITELDRSSNRIAIGMVMSSLILASALVIRTGGSALWLSVPAFVLSSLLGIWLIYGIFRSGRL